VYIGGLGRSGSTLLDRMLGQVPGFFSAGELREIWHRGLQQGALCGCGQPFRECPFWTPVGDVAFGGWDRVDLEEVLALSRKVDKHRWLPLLARPGSWPPFDRLVRRYLSYVAPVYRAIHEVGSTRVIVDSSKAPSTAFLLRGIEDLDLRFIHLVRDSRAVAYSWTKEVRRPDMNGDAYMHRFPPVRIGLRWVTRNSVMEALSPTKLRSSPVRYETLIDEPRSVLERVLRQIGEPFGPDDLEFIEDRHVTLGIAHTVMGNPSRMATGLIPLELDEEWRAKLGRGSGGVVTALTWPLLRKYGYR
jgi:hypothetical protein